MVRTLVPRVGAAHDVPCVALGVSMVQGEVDNRQWARVKANVSEKESERKRSREVRMKLGLKLGGESVCECNIEVILICGCQWGPW